MNELLRSGALIDVAFACIGVELLVLLGVRRLLGGLRVADVVGQLLAGAILLLAVRSAMRGADPRWTLALVTASLPAHVYDLLRRVHRARARSTQPDAVTT